MPHVWLMTRCSNCSLGVTVNGHDLASRPTLSRFENTIRRRDLLRMSEALAEAVINRHKRRKKKVKLIGA